MNNREAMQKAFEGQKFKVFSPFKCDISKNENGNYVEDETIFAFAWFCRGIASHEHQLSGNSVQLPSNPICDCNKVVRSILENTTNNHIPDVGKMVQSQAQQTELGNQSINKLLKSAESVIEDLLKLIDTPPRRNCSCHIAPPCSDCVDYSYTREVLDQANDFMASLPPAPEVCSDGGKCGAGGYCITCPNMPAPEGGDK